MRNSKTAILLFLLLAATFTYSIPALRDQAQQKIEQANENKNSLAQQEQQKADFESQFPLAEYSGSTPNSKEITPEKEVKRNARAIRLRKRSLTLHENAGVTFDASSMVAQVPAIPVNQSNVIITGEILNATAFVSDQTRNVYSEFTVRINEVLKNDGHSIIASGNSLEVGRSGGRVRFPSGKVTLVYTAGEGMPRVGHQYIFFLTRSDQEDFDILTGYELRNGHVFLLDNPNGGDHPMANYQGKDEGTFLNEVRALIEKSSQNIPQKGKDDESAHLLLVTPIDYAWFVYVSGDFDLVFVSNH
jgi:hypothetical protein